MINKTDVRVAATVVVGVMIAGYLMAQFSNIAAVAQSRDGFGA